jgi:chromosomal replication initiation ATPase DnaA
VTCHPQLALPFPHRAGYDPAAFLPAASNRVALAWLDHPETWPNHRLALFGEPGSGKTYLLHLFAARRGASLVQGQDLAEPPALPIGTPLGIDDADLAPPALLHWLNAAAEAHCPVLLAARTPPSRWRVTLPDLQSRLRATTAVGIEPPDDDLLRALFARLFAERQLRVDEAVQDYLLTRLPRSCAALREAAARLDHLSLATGRRVTRPLAAALLGETPPADEDSAQPAEGLSPDAASLL